MKNNDFSGLLFLISILIVPIISFANEGVIDNFVFSSSLMEATYKIECRNSLGTAFLLGHASRKENETAHYVLITAKHVLEDFKLDIAILNLRKRAGDVYERLPHEIRIRKDGKPLWVSHPEADVAALRVSIPQNANIRSIRLISTALLADDQILEKYELQPGDELMALGFPFGVESNEAGFPVLRSGRIASYPLVPTSKTKTFLLDFEVYKGNSGGPVFLYNKFRHYAGKPHAGNINFIVGLVSQEIDLTEKVQSLEQFTVKRHRLALAVIVHAKLIRETIELLFPKNPIPDPNMKGDT